LIRLTTILGLLAVFLAISGVVGVFMPRTVGMTLEEIEAAPGNRSIGARHVGWACIAG
jgi:hypothetical protein